MAQHRSIVHDALFRAIDNVPPLPWSRFGSPANARASIDPRRRPETGATTCPRWCRLAFVLQIAVVFVYAGIAMCASPSFRWAVVQVGCVFDLLIVPLLLHRRTPQLDGEGDRMALGTRPLDLPWPDPLRTC